MTQLNRPLFWEKKFKMRNQIKYTLGAIASIPFLPIMYFQSRKIKRTIPQLPEATGTEGFEGHSPHQINLLTLGESTIAGVGVDSHKNGFTGALAKTLSQGSDFQVNWKVFAKSGYTAKQVALELIPKIKNFQPDIIVIGLGANDAFNLHSPKRWRAGMNEVLTKLNNKFPNAKIVCNNMPPIKEFPAFTPIMKKVIGNLVELFGSELDKMVKNYNNVSYINEKMTLDNWVNKFDLNLTRNDFFSDGVHPSKLTYQTWGMEVANFILNNNKMELFTGK